MAQPLPQKLQNKLNSSIKYSIDNIIKYYKDLADYKNHTVNDRKKISFTSRVLNELLTANSNSPYNKLCRPQDSACLLFAEKTNMEALIVNKRAYSLWALCSKYEDHYKAICREHEEEYKEFIKKHKTIGPEEISDDQLLLYNAIQEYSKALTSTYAINALKEYYAGNSLIESWKNVRSLKDLDFATNASSTSIKKEENPALHQSLKAETKVGDQLQSLSINEANGSQKFQQRIKSEKNTMTKSL